MASGLGVRFGRNKLLAEFQGKTLFQRALDMTGEGLFAERVVVTRCEEVRDLCKQQDVNVIFHTFPNRNDTVRLGIDFMKHMDGCMFYPCDQPLLQRESIKQLVDQFAGDERKIFRLSYKGKQGAPILFGKDFFDELSKLPPKCGGSYLIQKYPDKLELVPVGNKVELFDIDTQEDYNWLIEEYC